MRERKERTQTRAREDEGGEKAAWRLEAAGHEDDGLGGAHEVLTRTVEGG